MVSIAPVRPVSFLHSSLRSRRSIGVLLKNLSHGPVMSRYQRICLSHQRSRPLSAWLRHYERTQLMCCRLNAYRPGRSRAREAVAQVSICSSRGLDGPGLSARVHATGSAAAVVRAAFVAWAATRALAVRDIAPSRVEQLQKELARELLTDRAAVVHADHEVAGIFQSQATAIGSCRHRVPPLARRLRGEGSASLRRRDNPIEHDEGAATVAGHALGGACTRISPVRRSRCRRTAGRSADVSCLLSNRARI